MTPPFQNWQILLLEKRGSTEEYPFDEQTAVYKAGGKMFALLAKDETPLRITLKCPPEEAEALRTLYPAIVPGYYMNKRHWNTVTLDGSVPDEELVEMVETSYRLVIASLPKAARDAFSAQAAGQKEKQRDTQKKEVEE